MSLDIFIALKKKSLKEISVRGRVLGISSQTRYQQQEIQYTLMI